MHTVAVIPARYASTRFPGKPLAQLLGKPMIAWVVAAALRASRIDEVVVATDDERIALAAVKAGAKAVMTRPDCASGTDRVAEAARGFSADVIINVQGDEPAVDHRDLDRLVEVFASADPPQMATLARVATAESIIRSPDVVKVVRGSSGDALYFSRSPIPHYRDGGSAAGGTTPTLIHVGVYAYAAKALADFAAKGVSPLEDAEKLEQLRALEAGWRIRVIDAVGAPGIGVDRPEDIETAEKLLAARIAGQG